MGLFGGLDELTHKSLIGYASGNQLFGGKKEGKKKQMPPYLSECISNPLSTAF